MKASFRFTVCLLALVLLLSSGLPGAMAASAPGWLPAQETDAAASDWAERMTALPAFDQVYLSWQPMQGSLPPAPSIAWEDSRAILRGLAAWGVAEEEMRAYRWEESEDFGGYFVADESSSLLEDEIVLHVPSPRPQTLETPLLSCGDAFVSFTYWALSDEDGGYALDQVFLSLDGGDVVFYQLTISPEFTLNYYNPDSPWNRTSASYDAQGRLLSAQTRITLPSYDDYWFEIVYRKNPLQSQEYRFEYLVHDNVNGVYYVCQEDSARQKLWTKGGTRDEITPPQSIVQMVEELPVLDILGEAKASSAPDWMPAEQPQDALPLEDRLTPLPKYGEAYLDWQPVQGTLPAAPAIAFEDSRVTIRGLAAWGVTEDQMRVYDFVTMTGFMETPKSPELEDEVVLNVSSQWLQSNVDTLSTIRFKSRKDGRISFGYEFQPAEEGGEGAFVLEEVRISYEDGSIHFYDLASSAPAFTLYYYGDSGAEEMTASYDAQGRLSRTHFSVGWENGSLTMEYANCTSQMNAYGFSYIDISDEKNDARYRCAYSLDWRRLRWWSGFHDHGPDEITPPQDIAELVLAQPLPLVLIGQEGETYSVRADELFLYQHPE